MSAELKSIAVEASLSAYAPYSKLSVGSALRSAKGNIYSGCNVENASFSVGGCAERAALAAAVLAEGAQFKLIAIAVVAFDQQGRALPVSPCGACRQALIEFGENAEVGFVDPQGLWLCVKAGDLLPHRFAFPEI